MNDTLRKADDSLRKADPRMGFANGLRQRWTDCPQAFKRVVALLGIALLFYLPFIKHYPFALIRTDLGNSGSDWSSVLFIVDDLLHHRGRPQRGDRALRPARPRATSASSRSAPTPWPVRLPTSPVTTYLQNRFDLSDEWAVAGPPASRSPWR